MEVNLLTIKKIGEDYGGDNLLYRINVPKMKNIENIEDKLWDINSNHRCDFIWAYDGESYDNLDYNGHFFSTVYIDKENLCHKMDGDEVIIDSFINDLVLGDFEELMIGLYE